ncbi:MAG: SRPBCC family protein [Aggregatilineales bacterium]
MDNPQQPNNTGQNGGTRHIIDHAISIPATHNDVWYALSQLHNNPQWQTDCKSVAFITTNRNGEGTRMRCTGVQGKEYVVEVTAWYERLGYEYIIVDGVPYGQNRGRIRLQEIAEGTIVQWSFSYELGGMFSGLRNNLGIKRTLDKHITESLRNLWRYMKEISEQPDLEEVRSLMRDAPDVDQRASYEPRYPSLYEQFKVQGELQRDTPDSDEIVPSLSSMILDEPPVEQDDTRPNPVVQEDASDSVVTTEPEKPLEKRETGLSQSTAPQVTQEHASVEASDSDKFKPPSIQNEIIEETASIAPEINVDLSDTSRVSVFDVFGVAKPSESQQIKAVTLDDEEAVSIESHVETTDSPEMIESTRVDSSPSQPEPDTSDKPGDVEISDNTISTSDDVEEPVLEVQPDIVGVSEDAEETNTTSILNITASASGDEKSVHQPRQGLRRIIRQQQQNLRLPE